MSQSLYEDEIIYATVLFGLLGTMKRRMLLKTVGYTPVYKNVILAIPTKKMEGYWRDKELSILVDNILWRATYLENRT